MHNKVTFSTCISNYFLLNSNKNRTKLIIKLYSAKLNTSDVAYLVEC
jgi:hypothetical protein